MAAGYTERSAAPPPVRAAIASADPLLAEARAGRLWIPVDDLLNGSVRAFLGTGEVSRVREAFDLLRPRTSRMPGDPRLALLRAYLERAETTGSRTEP